MTEAAIIEAKTEAERFLKRVEALMNDPYDWPKLAWGSANSGAVRRASMDLTRALAKMRRSW